MNRPALKSVATLKVTFYVLLFGLSLFFVRLDFGSAVSVPDRWYLWGNLVALAVFPDGDIVSLYDSRHPIHRFDSHGYSGALEPVTAVFFGVAVFGESLTLRIGCGILLIIVAVSLIVAGNRIASYLVRFRKLFPRLPLNRKKVAVMPGNNRLSGWRATGCRFADDESGLSGHLVRKKEL